MLARLQQTLVFAALLLAGGSLWAGWQLGRPLLGVAIASVVLGGYAAVLALEFVLLGLVHRDDPAPRASMVQLLAAWWGEVHYAPRVFCWRQPFRSRLIPDHLPANGRGQQGLLLVHGFVCNRGLWNPWLQRLRAQGVPFVAVNLEPVFGSIDRYAAIVQAGVRQLEEATGLPPVIVAHSMGGLAVRAWLRANPTLHHVQHVATIGTPHHGTWLGRWGHTPNTRQMRWQGAWVRGLAQGESEALRARFTCFYSHCDNIVFPPSTATLPGADNRHLPGWSHVHMIEHPAVFDHVQQLLRR